MVASEAAVPRRREGSCHVPVWNERLPRLIYGPKSACQTRLYLDWAYVLPEPQIYVRAFDLDERLVGVAFLDVGVYVTSLRAVKNLLVIGDAVKSVWFVAFQVRPVLCYPSAQFISLAPCTPPAPAPPPAPSATPAFVR